MLKNLSRIVLYVLCAITIAVTCLFFLGGEVDSTILNIEKEPTYTDAMVYLMYACIFMTALFALVSALWQFVMKLQSNRNSAIKTIVSFSLTIIVLVAGYFISSGQSITLLGSGEVVEEQTITMVDMMIYTIYTMVGAAILLMILGPLAKNIK